MSEHLEVISDEDHRFHMKDLREETKLDLTSPPIPKYIYLEMEYRNIMSGMLKGIRSKHLGDYKLCSFVHEEAKSLLFCPFHPTDQGSRTIKQ